MRHDLTTYWSLTEPDLLGAVHTVPGGLTPEQAAARLRLLGRNTLQVHRTHTGLRLLLNQFTNPLVLILVFAAFVSAFVREWIDAAVILVVIVGSALLGFWQEYRAANAVDKLRARVTLRAFVLRGGQQIAIPAEEVVQGDIVQLSAGSLIPADGVVIETQDFFVNQAVLTGETFPVEKSPGAAPVDAPLAARTNCVYMGTSVRSGRGRMVVVQTGAATAFGQIAQRLTLRPPETEFEHGLRRFGMLLTQVMLALVFVVFAANVFAAKPPIDSLLFSVALAVGLAPELLPAIVSITLARGAQDMARNGVIVRRLTAIENLGSMDVLCSDKTGTLTLGVVQLDAALDVTGQPSAAVLFDAYCNAALQTGLANALDEAVVAAGKAQDAPAAAANVTKVAEIPYDFVRKRMSVVIDHGHSDGPAHVQLITKGALEPLLAVCDRVQVDGNSAPFSPALTESIAARYAAWSAQGYRVLGVAMRPVDIGTVRYTRDDECGLIFTGFLLFFDPPKADVRQTLDELTRLGVHLKVITGDNRLVTEHVAQAVGLPVQGVLTGAQIGELRDEALWHLAERTTLFVEVDPNQKERIILALHKMGHVIGYMGDGINDAPALHAADVGISVDSAVDVAKEAADFVLLEHSLGVLRQGIEEGRRTFANTLKYIFTTTSANFGNMFSMAGASIFLPFLPLLAKQILLNNFLSDIPGMAIAGDRVDCDLVETPHRWNVKFIRSFMVTFGLVSSVFDYLTFGLLLFVVHATPDVFRTGWFIESLLTELVIALVVRTRRPFYRSRPSGLLLGSTLAVAALTLVLPYLPFSVWLGFVPLPLPLLAMIVGITGLYVVAAEITKRKFYAHPGNRA